MVSHEVGRVIRPRVGTFAQQHEPNPREQTLATVDVLQLRHPALEARDELLPHRWRERGASDEEDAADPVDAEPSRSTVSAVNLIVWSSNSRVSSTLQRTSPKTTIWVSESRRVRPHLTSSLPPAAAPRWRSRHRAGRRLRWAVVNFCASGSTTRWSHWGAAEAGVAPGRDHADMAVGIARARGGCGYVEGAAAEVVDQHGFVEIGALGEAIGHRRRGRLVDDVDDLEAGDLAGGHRRLPLGNPEVGGNGDDGPLDLLARLQLSVLAERLEHVGGPGALHSASWATKA